MPILDSFYFMMYSTAPQCAVNRSISCGPECHNVVTLIQEVFRSYRDCGPVAGQGQAISTRVFVVLISLCPNALQRLSLKLLSVSAVLGKLNGFGRWDALRSRRCTMNDTLGYLVHRNRGVLISRSRQVNYLPRTCFSCWVL